jgi:hypothetical protein
MKYGSSAKLIAMKAPRKLLIGAVVAIGSAMAMAGCDGEGPASAIEVTAPPGAVVVLRYDRPVKGAPKRAMSYIPARPVFNPSPLPENALLVHNGLGLHGSGDISGELLIQVPEDAQGAIQFSVSASGDGSRAVGGASVFFAADEVNVTISIEGEQTEFAPPDLVGEWNDGKRKWIFRESQIPILNIHYASGEEKTIRYNIYPDGRGRWFLVESGLVGTAYWIEIDESGGLLVSHVGEIFDPFTRYTRER